MDLERKTIDHLTSSIQGMLLKTRYGKNVLVKVAGLCFVIVGASTFCAA